MSYTAKSRLPMFLLSLCLVALVPAAFAKNGLNCTVVDENDKPIAKQEVTLTSASGKSSKKKTNDQGEVKFGGLDDGAYTLAGEIQGYVAAKSAAYELSGNAEKPCKYIVVSASFANGKLQEVMQLIQQKKTADAEALAKQLIEMMPGEGSTHYVLAVAYAYDGSDSAETEVKKAAELSPDKFKDKVMPIQMQALNQQAEAAKQKRDYQAAIKKYEAMQKLSPNDATVYYNMAVAYASAKDYAGALKNIELTIILKPDDQEAAKLKAQFEKAFDDTVNKKLEK